MALVFNLYIFSSESSEKIISIRQWQYFKIPDHQGIRNGKKVESEEDLKVINNLYESVVYPCFY